MKFFFKLGCLYRGTKYPVTTHYEDMMKLFSPGYAVADNEHPIIQNLAHPFFKRILSYSDQVVFILNHSNFEFLYISENLINLIGTSVQDYKAAGFEESLKRCHPEDTKSLITTVYPELYRCFDSLSSEQKFKIKSSYTMRFKSSNGVYKQILQQNIPLTIENGKVILGLIVWMDISAYKKDDLVTYKTVLVNGNDSVTILSQGICENNILTDREIRVLQLTANGLSEKEIADRLSISLHTIKSHRKNMIRKTGVKNAAELVRFGVANLIIQ